MVRQKMILLKCTFFENVKFIAYQLIIFIEESKNHIEA
jgi:hypothetical protein